jgi:competence protein ComEC
MPFFIGATVSFVIGIAVQTFLDDPISIALWLMVLAFCVGMVWRRGSSVSSSPVLILMSLCLIFLSLGIIRTEIFLTQFETSSLETQIGETVSVSGVIIKEPDFREKTVQLYVETNSGKLLVSTDKNVDIEYGDKVNIEGKLSKPESFETELGRTFDYQTYLKIRGVEYKVSFAEVEIIEKGLGNPIVYFLLKTKEKFVDSIQSVIPEPQVGLGSGLLLGIKSALGDDIEEDFRRTGIIHIVVLSGYNVMLVVAFIIFCFSFLLSHRSRMVAGVVAIVCFALIVGLSPTVVRASIMAVLVLIAQSYGRQYDVTRGLLFAGLVMLFINPYLIYDIGFQLSFVATLGLIMIVPKLEESFVNRNKGLGLREFFLATVSTQIAVLPLLMYHIGEISLIAVLVNILVLPIVPLAMMLTFLTGILGFVSMTAASMVGFVATLSLSYILLIAHWFSSFPFATITVPQFGVMGTLGLYLVMAAGLYYWENRTIKENNPFSDWVIEEEKEPSSLPNESTSDEPSSLDPPVFFR